MKIGIVGAGAIGCYFAARLAKAGNEVSMLARGDTLDALRRHGVRYEGPDEAFSAPVSAADDARALGPQDLLIIAVKSYSLPQVLPHIGAMLGKASDVMPALNGVPWWFFNGDEVAPLRSVDPDGTLARTIDRSRIVGSVVFPACSCPEPGLVRHASGSRIVIGEPGGGDSPRVHRLLETLQGAGLAAEASDNVRRDLWLKLLGNACFNPVSMLTGSPTDRMIDDPEIYRLFVGMMTELIEIGRAMDIEVAIDPAERIALTRKLGNVKTSMLQDAEAGRPVELDGILGAPVELAERLGVPAPLLGLVAALCRRRAQVQGLVP